MALAAGLAGAQNPIELRTEIYVVSEVTASDGSKEERLTPADSAIPGQVVEYRIMATNAGETTLPAGRVQIFGPVQGGTAYVKDSATPSAEGELLTEFTADGDTYGTPPLLVGEGDDRREAPASEYAGVRWTLLVPLEPGQEVTFTYRVQLLE